MNYGDPFVDLGESPKVGDALCNYNSDYIN